MSEAMAPQQFLELLQNEVKAYRKIKDLALGQKEVIERLDTNALLEILARKKAIFDTIDDIEKVVGATKRDWPVRKKDFTAADAERAEAMMREQQVLLSELKQLEQEAFTQVEASRHEKQKEINRLSSGKQLNSAYGKMAIKRRNILDREG